MRTPSVHVVADARRVALLATEIVANRLRARPGLRLMLPTGATPRGMYAGLRAHAADGSLPTAHATAFGLDEYLGLGAGDPRSFRATLRREAGPLGFAALEGLDGAAADPQAEADRYQALLDRAPIGLAVLGIGRDAHVAFDEPGSTPDAGVRRVALHPSTIDAAAGEFGGRDNVPREALTTGLRTLLAAREVLVLATGAAKADALHAMLEGPETDDVPASLLRDHPGLTVVCDEAAAARLAPAPGRASSEVVVVLGHREPGVSAEHRIDAHSRARLLHAEERCLADPPRAALLTGYTHTGGLSEAEQMAREWTVPGVPLLLEVAGRDTAENASRSLPLVLALGGVRTVIVVTSPWHVRARPYFAPYGRFGLRVEHRPGPALRGWAHLLAGELAGLHAVPRRRAEAMGEVRLLSLDDVTVAP